AVPELDERVVAGRLVEHRGELTRLAQRPRRAAEPGPGQPHGATGDDDADLCDDVRDQDPARPPAEPGERVGAPGTWRGGLRGRVGRGGGRGRAHGTTIVADGAAPARAGGVGL